jgi:hypothetical protein
MIDDKLINPFKRMGLLDLYNGLNVIQTWDYIKINCSMYLDKISIKHLSTWMKNFDIPTGHPTPNPGRDSFIKTFSSAMGDPDHALQDKLSKEMGFGYRLGFGELIYAMVNCCPDISYAVLCCAQSSVCPAEIHYHAVKHILKYLYLTKDDGLHYWCSTLNKALPAAKPPCINSSEHDLLLDRRPMHDAMDLHGYVDSNWATCPKTHWSFTGVCV